MTCEYPSSEQQLQARRESTLQMGGEAKLQARREAGVLNARERLEGLLDPQSFSEIGMLAHSSRPEDRDSTPADGKITGFGRIDSRRVAVVSNDMTVKGASSSWINARKIAYMKECATRNGMPLIFLGESSGQRMQDAMGAASMASGGQDAQQYCRRRETPWVSAVLGPCFGSASWYSCLADFTVMRKGALLAVSSPKVTSVAIGESSGAEELGGWRMHAEITGLADRVVNTDQEALSAIRQFLSYLPSHSNEPPALLPCGPEDRPGPSATETIVPAERSKTYDMRKLLATLVDRDSLFTLKDRFGRSVVTALARLEGASIGIVASNPQFKGGALDADACRKATGFIAMCDSFNIPLVFLVDTPGFLVGIEGEKRSAPAHIMNMIHAVQLCSVPKLSVIVRKSFGQAYLNFGGGRNSDQSAAWCSADVSFVDPGVAVSVVHDVTRETDPERYERLHAEFSKDTSAFALAGALGTHEVIAPGETRRFLVEALAAQRRAINNGIGRHEMRTWPTYF